MKLETYDREGVCVVKPQDARLDARVAVEFKNRLAELIDQGKRAILLDLAHVDFLDSSGLGAIVASLRRVGREGDLRLSSLKPGVRSVVELTRLDKVLTIHDNEDEALKHYPPAPR